MLEETEKFEAIRKVNASEILRLRELVKNRRSRVKDAATAPATMVAKLPEEATMYVCILESRKSTQGNTTE